MSAFRRRVISELSESRAVKPQETYEQLQARARFLTQALINIKDCPESDLAKYCETVDAIACQALVGAGDG